MRTAHRLGWALAFSSCLVACRPRESAQAALDRTVEQALVKQIADLKALVERAEKGELQSSKYVAIGLSEATSKEIIGASLPQEKVLGDRVRVRIERVQPYFRGNNAAIVFEAVAQGLKTGATAHLELGGRLTRFRIEEGQLKSDIELLHFRVLDSSLGDLGSGVLENLVRTNLPALGELAPELNVPVRLEHTIEVDGLDAGVVVAKGGSLPMAVAVAEVVPLNERLWVLLDVKVGPWKSKARRKS